MNYWWVNHKQTFKVELHEGCIWSPKSNNDGSTNQSYLNLTKAKIGDVIFSYANAQIKAIGIVSDNFSESPRPTGFGKAGKQWSEEGWLLPVKWKLITDPISPKNYITRIAPLLPTKYSPIQKNGNGNQGIYLANISHTLGRLLVDMIDVEDIGARSVIHDLQEGIIEEREEEAVRKSDESPTTKLQLIEARIGQGYFRNEVERIEKKCRVTGLDKKAFLTASHIKPWRVATNGERLNGHNGLLLSPHIDRLFDKGYISFLDNGKLLLANTKELQPIMTTWSLNPYANVGSFTTQQKYFLAYHRDEIYKRKVEDLKEE